MNMGELLFFVILVCVALLWLEGMRAREIAGLAARAACKNDDVQFLDETVSFASIRFARDRLGRLTTRRAYQFEFSDTGDNRLEGRVELLGRRVDTLYMDPHRM